MSSSVLFTNVLKRFWHVQCCGWFHIHKMLRDCSLIYHILYNWQQSNWIDTKNEFSRRRIRKCRFCMEVVPNDDALLHANVGSVESNKGHLAEIVNRQKVTIMRHREGQHLKQFPNPSEGASFCLAGCGYYVYRFSLRIGGASFLVVCNAHILGMLES
ncbi:hypothetical protein LIPSTDRAFT_236949 [Lipomyces starkeyi NRRL Y-11557]|uniref:Uncharacterized protein n=1 Tax=Lipomyces starkeyi NRRL Y-11557 TaxID=675824 RepID=A0A1E3QD75_LIPST|nr:hypothetical protein LIPSTDRAFT_236949 [Lipomyces starkeyi NRRL Y-11557]